jgi:hypothetical protein
MAKFMGKCSALYGDHGSLVEYTSPIFSFQHKPFRLLSGYSHEGNPLKNFHR